MTHLNFYLSEKAAKQFELILEELKQSNLSEEAFLYSKINNSGIEVIKYNHSMGRDEGLDLVFTFEGVFFLVQLKWWTKQKINLTKIKEIMGLLYLNSYGTSLRKKGKEVRYVLLVPFTDSSLIKIKEQLHEFDSIIISNDNFIRFITNPKYYLYKLMEE